MNNKIEEYINTCSKVKVKKIVKSKNQGKRKRFEKIKEKANNFKGFGDRIPDDSPTTHWYCIEYKRETEEEEELIELHWVKVCEPQSENMRIIKRIMKAAGMHDIKFSPTDFIVSTHFGHSMSDRHSHLIGNGVNCAFLYKANYKGDRTLREPIGICHGFGHDFDDSDITAFAFKYCEVAEIVPGHAVTLENKRAKRLTDRDIKEALEVISDRIPQIVERLGFLWRIKGTGNTSASSVRSREQGTVRSQETGDRRQGIIRVYKKVIRVEGETKEEAIALSLISLIEMIEVYRTNVEVKLLKEELLRVIEKIEPRLMRCCDRLSPLPTSQLSKITLKLSEKLENATR